MATFPYNPVRCLMRHVLPMRHAFAQDAAAAGDGVAPYRLSWQSPFLALAAVGLVLAGTWALAYVAARTSVTQTANDHLAAVATLKVEQLTDWIQERHVDVQALTQAPQFAQTLQAWLKDGRHDARQREILLDHLRNLALAAHYRDISIRAVDDGALLLSTGGDLVDTPPVRAQAMAAASGPRIEDLHFMHPGAAAIDLGFLSPIVIGNAPPVAILHITLDPTDSLYSLIQDWHGTSPSAETLLVQVDGDQIVFLNNLRHQADSALRFRLPLTSQQLLAAQAAIGVQNPLTGVDYRGVPSLGHALPVTGTPWLLIAKVDAAEIYAQLNRMAAYGISVAVLLLLAGSWWIAERNRLTLIRYRDMLEHGLLSKRIDFLAKYANDAILLLDTQGLIVEVNDRAMSSYGYAHAEFLGMDMAQIRSPRARHDEFTLLAQQPGDGGLIFETEHRAKDGRLFPVEVSVRCIEMAGEIRIQAIVRDISARLAAERALRTSELRFRRLSRLHAAISGTNHAIVHSRTPHEVYEAVCRACVELGHLPLAWVGVADLDMGRIVPVAAAGESAGFLDGIVVATGADTPAGQGPTGIAYREQRICSCTDYFADPQTAPWRQRAAAYGVASSISLPLARGGLAYGALTVYAAEKDFFDDESIEILHQMANNISFILDYFDAEAQRAHAQQMLAQYSAQIEDLYQNSPCGYHSLDRDGLIVRINDTELGWLGYTRDEVVGRLRLTDLLNESGRRIFRETFSKFVAEGRIDDVETEMLRKDGSILPVVLSASAVVDANGEFAYSRTTVVDVTERKKIEAERAATAARVQALSHRLVAVQESERRQLAEALHDQTSPNLAAIAIILGSLARTLPPEARSAIDPAVADARALLKDTAANVRDICANLRPSVLDYAGLLPSLTSYAQQFARRTGVPVNVASQCGNGRLAPETESLLFRIAQEALTNCAKHAFAKSIDVVLSQCDGHVALTVADDGFGFDPQQLGQPGSAPGLGLLTMRERAEFAGGTFTVASRPGQGTTISVRLALVAASPDAPEPAQRGIAETHPNGGGHLTLMM